MSSSILCICFSFITITQLTTAHLFDEIQNPVKFVHPSLKIQTSVGKGQGIFVTGNDTIPMGTVLIVEDPILDMNNRQISTKIIAKKLTQLRQEDELYAGTLDSLTFTSGFLPAAHSRSDLTQRQITDIAKYLSNEIQQCLYTLTSKINHGHPQNIYMVKDPPSEMTTRRMTVYATTDLNPEDELKWDYFDLLSVCSWEEIVRNADRHQIFLAEQFPFRGYPMYTALFGRFKALCGEETSLDDYLLRVELMQEMVNNGLIFALYGNGYSIPLLEQIVYGDREIHDALIPSLQSEEVTQMQAIAGDISVDQVAWLIIGTSPQKLRQSYFVQCEARGANMDVFQKMMQWNCSSGNDTVKDLKGRYARVSFGLIAPEEFMGRDFIHAIDESERSQLKEIIDQVDR